MRFIEGGFQSFIGCRGKLLAPFNGMICLGLLVTLPYNTVVEVVKRYIRRDSHSDLTGVAVAVADTSLEAGMNEVWQA
jgi:hypothetical protein